MELASAMVSHRDTPALTLNSMAKDDTVSAWLAVRMLPFVKSALLMSPPLMLWVQVLPLPAPPKSARPLQSLSWPSQISALPGKLLGSPSSQSTQPSEPSLSRSTPSPGASAKPLQSLSCPSQISVLPG